MKAKFAVACAIAFLAGAIVPPLAWAAYQTTIMNDGTNSWAWSSVSNQLAIQGNGSPAALTIDPLGGPIVPASTVALLPTCTAALKGAVRMITDATTPTYNAAAAGSGAVVTLAVCNGAGWVTH